MGPHSSETALSALPSWMAAMRQAAMDEIKPADVQAIVRRQINLAKEGNPAALKFVFEYVLGGNQMRGATFVQNVYNGDASPVQPTKARPGSKDKLAVMAKRAAAGLPLSDPRDGTDDEDAGAD